MSVHPEKAKLKRFVEGKLPTNEAEAVKAHMKGCEFCSEFCDDYKTLLESLNSTWSEEIPQSAWTFANNLRSSPGARGVIDLKKLIETASDIVSAITPTPQLALAADGSKGDEVNLPRCLATYYSEEPNLVLRIMSYPEQKDKYIQLASENPELSSNVILQLPDFHLNILTDKEGRAILQEGVIEDFTDLKWQVKLPDTEFRLSPLVYDPNKTEYSSETVLETDRKDKIRVRFEGKTEGKLITVEVLQLEGKLEFGSVKVAVSQESVAEFQEASVGKPISFRNLDIKKPISIKLFK
jgi:hypothetical protein